MSAYGVPNNKDSARIEGGGIPTGCSTLAYIWEAKVGFIPSKSVMKEQWRIPGFMNVAN
jgi:hypothetical protein